MLRAYIRAILTEGVFEAPPAMLDAIYIWAKQELKKYQTEVRSGQNFKPLNIKKEFPINLTGWRYGDVLEQYLDIKANDGNEMIKQLNTMIAQAEKEDNYEKVESIKKTLSVISKSIERNPYKTITVSLEVGTGHVGAYWQPASSELKIFYRSDMDLRGAIEHELRHFGQTLLSQVKKAKVGFPSRNIATGESNVGTANLAVNQHHLSDEEFYTVLADEIKKAQLQWKNRQRTNNLNEFIKHFINNSRFFSILKKQASGKFRKALSELVKAFS